MRRRDQEGIDICDGLLKLDESARDKIVSAATGEIIDKRCGLKPDKPTFDQVADAILMRPPSRTDSPPPPR